MHSIFTVRLIRLCDGRGWRQQRSSRGSARGLQFSSLISDFKRKEPINTRQKSASRTDGISRCHFAVASITSTIVAIAKLVLFYQLLCCCCRRRPVAIAKAYQYQVLTFLRCSFENLDCYKGFMLDKAKWLYTVVPPWKAFRGVQT